MSANLEGLLIQINWLASAQMIIHFLMELLVSSVTIHSILIFKKNNASIVLRIKFMIYKLRGVYFVL